MPILEIYPILLSLFLLYSVSINESPYSSVSFYASMRVLFVGTDRKMQLKDMRNSFRENREHYLDCVTYNPFIVPLTLLSSHRFFVLIESHSTLRSTFPFFILAPLLLLLLLLPCDFFAVVNPR